MAARIVHFGVDEAYRLAILSRAGFKVEDCSSSLQQLSNAFKTKRPVDAVVLSEDEGLDSSAEKAVRLVRSKCNAPVILFRNATARREHSDVDLIIPSLTEPSIWLDAIRAVVARSQVLREQLHSLRQEYLELKQKSTDVRLQSAAARKRSAYTRAKTKDQLRFIDSPSGKTERNE